MFKFHCKLGRCAMFIINILLFENISITILWLFMSNNKYCYFLPNLLNIYLYSSELSNSLNSGSKTVVPTIDLHKCTFFNQILINNQNMVQIIVDAANIFLDSMLHEKYHACLLFC